MKNYRLKKVFQFLNEKELDSFLITNPYNIFYLTGSWAQGAVLISPSEQLFFTSPLFSEQTEKNLSDFKIVISRDNFIEPVTKMFKKLDNKKVGFENSYISLNRYEKLKDLNKEVNFIPLKNIIEDLRVLKDEKEISRIKKAHSVTLRCFGHLKKNLRNGVTERDLSAEAVYFFRKMADKESFEPIVLFGERTSLPHGIPTQRKLKENELVLLDIGAKMEEYCADLTTMVFWGEVSEKWHKIYKLLTTIQEEIIKEIKPGIKSSQIDGMVRKKLNKAGYLDAFIHSTGHGVGLEVHERPFISEKSQEELKEGMIFTLEPGVYFPGKGGIRVERMVIVNKTGGKFLNDYC